MFTYQVRPRRFAVPTGELRFPNKVRIKALVVPSEQFGVGDGPTHVTAQHAARSLIMDANTGKHWFLPPNPLLPVTAAVDAGGLRYELTGNELTLTADCRDLEELESLCEQVYYALPPLLNLDFFDSVVIGPVTGTVGETQFHWELREMRGNTDVTNQEVQSERAALACRRVEYLVPVEHRRLFGALHFFHQACRLARAGHSPWEFMGEVLLNLCKVLETLFPPDGDGQTRASARRGLQGLGFGDAEIERDFLPSMALRSTVDVGHVGLALFTQRQLAVFHRYTLRAEGRFRELLRRVLRAMDAGPYQLARADDLRPSREALTVLERLEQSLGPSGDE